MSKEDTQEPIWIRHDGQTAETNAAKRLKFAEGEKWVPKSQILDERELKGKPDEDGNPVALPEVQLPRWLAEKKGLV